MTSDRIDRVLDWACIILAAILAALVVGVIVGLFLLARWWFSV